MSVDYKFANQSVGGCVPESEPEVVDADHRGQQILLLTADDERKLNPYFEFFAHVLIGHLPPLEHNQGIVVCIEVHICGCVKRRQDPTIVACR